MDTPRWISGIIYEYNNTSLKINLWTRRKNIEQLLRLMRSLDTVHALRVKFQFAVHV